MKYNLVLQDHAWVMESIAKDIAHFINNAYIDSPRNKSDYINFYLNWHAFKDKTYNDVCLFTHIEKGQEEYWVKQAKRCDVCVAVGKKYLNFLPSDKTIIFNIPPNRFFYNNLSLPENKLKLLVVGRPYNSGRKNFDLAFEIQEKYKDFVDLKFTSGSLTTKEVLSYYSWCDYVLITSKIESGPMCVPEALVMKKPVIAPDVGWCWDYPVIRYKDKEDLFVNIIEKMYFSNYGNRQCYINLFMNIEKILNKRNEQN